MLLHHLLVPVLLVVAAETTPASRAPGFNPRVTALLEKMTVEEKARQLDIFKTADILYVAPPPPY